MKSEQSRMTKFLVGALTFAIVFMATSSFIKTESPQERYAKVTANALPKTVTVFVSYSRISPRTGKKEYKTILGSGVFISPKGHILTCNHLFSIPAKIESVVVLLDDGSMGPARILALDKSRDLGLVKIGAHNTPYAKVADSKYPYIGQEVIAIGSPYGLFGTVTTGVVSATHRNKDHYDLVQLSAPINPGNSGGPLFDLKGEIVGINILLYSPNPFIPTWTGIGFSVSPSEINRFLTKVRSAYEGL